LLQLPFTAQTPFEREHVPELEPPPEPWHTHVRVVPHDVWPLSLIAVPAEQPSATPLLHEPLTAHTPLLCEQFAVEPPPDPTQFHVRVVPQDVAPLSDAAEPAEHTPGVPEHDPLTAHEPLLCEQFAVEPPPDPTQFHVRVVPQDVAPLSDAAEPAEHTPGVPEHDPLTGTTATGAEHDAFEPPPDPLQFHVHGPEPLTAVGVPTEHKFDDGALDTATPFADPQAPLSGVHTH
jgi:hypothetical protein